MSPRGIRASGEEVLVEVRVVPRASRNEIRGWDAAGRLHVRLAAPPVEGKANRALLKFLGGELGLPSGKLRVCRGEASRWKTVAVRGTTPAEVERILGRRGTREETS